MKEDSPATTGESRDEKGRFVKGVSGNPKGREPGSLSITSMIKEKLLEVPEGQKKTYAEAFILKIMKKAIQDEDGFMIKQVWNYIDGMPKEKLELEGDIREKIIFYIPKQSEDEEDK